MSLPLISSSSSTITFRQNISNSKPAIILLHHGPTRSRSTYIRLQPIRSRQELTGRLRCTERSGSSGEGEEDGAALDTVLRLYSAIKKKDLQQVSEVIGDECRCMSNFVSAFKPLHGKHQVLDFFAALLRAMGDHLEFIIQPTMDDGLNVGLQWTLACSKTHKPLGQGFSFYTAHSYKGKLVIRNVEMFLEPILHIEPLRLRLIGLLSLGMAQLGVDKLYERKKKGYLLLALIILILASLFFLNLSPP